MHLTYKKKIFLYFLLVFTIFTVIIIAVQHNREKTYKAESFTTGLNAYAEVVSNCIKEHQLLQSKHIDSLKFLLPLLPKELRVTVIDREGNVLFDNDIDSLKEVENHLTRPEIVKSLSAGSDGNRLFLLCALFCPILCASCHALRQQRAQHSQSG